MRLFAGLGRFYHARLREIAASEDLLKTAARVAVAPHADLAAVNRLSDLFSGKEGEDDSAAQTEGETLSGR